MIDKAVLPENVDTASPHSSNLQSIMEPLYWLLEGGDSEDREIQQSVFEISCGLFNLDAKDMEKSSAQVV
ncbi:hypothetical protein AB1E18_013051 [Capra hircus]